MGLLVPTRPNRDALPDMTTNPPTTTVPIITLEKPVGIPWEWE